jgi:hypothetical protein
MTNFIAYKKDSGEIIRVQYGWHDAFTPETIDMIIQNDYQGDTNIGILTIDDIDVPENAKVVNGKIEIAG